MDAWFLPLALALLSPPALAEGGGGVEISGTYMPQFNRRQGAPDAPGWLGCLGGLGYGVSQGGLRIGGDARWCRSNTNVRQYSGGMQLGWWRGNGRHHVSVYGGVGGGFLRDRSGEQDYRALFAYVRPTATWGRSFGGTALEVSVYADVPVNLAQWVGSGQPRGFVTPHAGLSLGLVWGTFAKRHEVVPPPAAPAPVMPPPERPLAIPAN